MTLPSNIKYCTITGRFIRAVLDDSDPDSEPDAIPIAGLTVTFAADILPAVLRDTSTVPPVTIYPSVFTATTNANGQLVGVDGMPGVLLIASDNPALDPNGWTWTATISGTGLSGGSVPRTVFSFVAPMDGTVDLTTVIPVPASPGTELIAWQQAVEATLAARDQAIAAAEVALPAGGITDQVLTKASLADFDVTWSDPPAGTGGGGAVDSVNGQSGVVVLDAADVGALPDSTVMPTADTLSGATTVGRAVLKATNAAAARTAIGAGTSNVAIGTITGTAADAGALAVSLADLGTEVDSKEAALPAGGTTATFLRGDRTWQAPPGTAVTSVNSKTGAVVLVASDVGAADATATTTALATKEPKLPAGGTTAQYLRGDKTWQTLPTGGSPTLATLPAGTLHIQRWDGTGSQPLRDTTRTDIPVEWRQATAPPSGGGYAINGVDTWLVTP